MPETYIVQTLAKLASDFVVKKKGSWNHDEWEQFLKTTTDKLEIHFDEIMEARLGLLLETLKAFYLGLPKRPKKSTKAKAKRKTPSRKKASSTDTRPKALQPSPDENA